MAFIIKQNDLRPYLTGQLRHPDKTPFDLNLVTGISLVMRKSGTTAIYLKKSIDITDAPNGKFQYHWVEPDTAVVGSYEAEIEVTWSGGEPQTVPVDSYYTITIVDDIG